MNYELINKNINPNLCPIEQILVNRGIAEQDIDHYLNTNTNDILDPCLIFNIENGAKMLIKHIAAKDKIYVQTDADCDGYTSAAVLINYLYQLFPSYTENYITWGLHKQKEHGIDLDFLPEDAKLIIVPDASSGEYELHKQLADQGIDILIIYHHEVEKISEYACVINNQLDNYPNKTLSGVGMVYKFCCYLDKLTQNKYADNLLDLVAVGLIGDMMDIRNFETKELIERGLNNIKNPFIGNLIDKDAFHFQGSITQHKIAFYLVPLINAVTRVGSLEDKQILFESILNHRANILIPSTKRGEKGKFETVVTQAVRMCTNIKKAQTNERDRNFNKVVELIKQNNLLEHKILAVRLAPEDAANKNLTGLIANEIANEYQHPTLILNEIIDEDGLIHYVGSARNFANSPIQELKDLMSNTQYCDYCAGHQNAFGFSILSSNFDNFLSTTDKLLENIDFSPKYLVDFIFSGIDDYKEIIFNIAEYEYLWGQALSEPLIAIENIAVTKNNITLMSKDKNPTLKITLSNGISLIKFKSSQEEFDLLNSEIGCTRINVVGTCALNEWMGNVNVQILITDYEITNKQKYYF